MPSGAIAIEAKRLSKTFGNRLVLNEIDLQVNSGEVVAIVGANGSGKTTLLRCLAARLRPSSGAVQWYGQSPFGNASSRRLVGTLGHESSLYPHQTVRENLLFAARMCDVVAPHSRVDDLLQLSGLEGQADRSASRISRGTRQRVAILRALLHEPLILLLDEPTLGLDTDGTNWLVESLKQCRNRGCAVCFATHDERSTEELADRVLQLHSGRVREIDRMACVSSA